MYRVGGRTSIVESKQREEASAEDRIGEDYYVEAPDKFWEDERKFIKGIIEHNEWSYYRNAYRILPEEKKPLVVRYTENFKTPKKKQHMLPGIELEQEFFPEELRSTAFRQKKSEIKNKKTETAASNDNAQVDNIIGLLNMEYLEKMDNLEKTEGAIDADIRQITGDNADESSDIDQNVKSDENSSENDDDNDYVEDYWCDDNDSMSAGSSNQEVIY